MNTSHIGKTCPYCQFPLKADSEVVECRACKVPHHRECWAENGGCTTFGCRETTCRSVTGNRIEISFDETSGRDAAPTSGGGVNKLLAASFFVSLIVLVVLLLNYYNLLTGDSEIVDHQDKTEILTGNTTGNIANGGLVAYYQEVIYYSGDSGHIYKSNLDGSKEIKLNDSSSMYINVLDDWIYYTNLDDGKRIYKMKTDGTDVIKLNDARSHSVCVKGGYIYYVQNEDPNELYSEGHDLFGDIYRMRIDGSERIKLIADVYRSLVMEGDMLYFCNKNGIFKMDTDGKDLTSITDADAFQIVVRNDWVYFVTDIHGAGDYVGGDTIARAKIDGSYVEELYSYKGASSSFYHFNINGENVYFVRRENAKSVSLDMLMITDGEIRTLIYAEDQWLSNAYSAGIDHTFRQ